MAVELSNDRESVEITYDQAVVQGDTINVKATNPADGDVSTRDGLVNDGKFTWTYPRGYAGTTEFVVTGSDSGEDSGPIEVDFA
jgi:hypothetical protein